MREEFEAWFADAMIGADTTSDRGKYVAENMAAVAWLAWQASRAALVVELPDDASIAASDDPWSVRDWCMDAVEAAGVTVK